MVDLSNLQPLGNRVLLKRIPVPPTIFITDAEESRVCLVLAVGPGKISKDGYLVPCDVQAGDIVNLPGIASTNPDFAVGDELLVTEDDIGFHINA